MTILCISSSLRNIFNILRGFVESSGRMFTPSVLVKLNLLFSPTRLSQLALDPPCPGLLPAPTPRPWIEFAVAPRPPSCVWILLPVACFTVPPLVLTCLCVGEVVEVSLFSSDEAVCVGADDWRKSDDNRRTSDDDWETTGDGSFIADYVC